MTRRRHAKRARAGAITSHSAFLVLERRVRLGGRKGRRALARLTAWASRARLLAVIDDVAYVAGWHVFGEFETFAPIQPKAQGAEGSITWTIETPLLADAEISAAFEASK